MRPINLVHVTRQWEINSMSGSFKLILTEDAYSCRMSERKPFDWRLFVASALCTIGFGTAFLIAVFA